jgi:hypothetical protein
LVLTYFVSGEGKTDLADKIITVSSFVFGIIIAFSISNRHSRLSDIREKLRRQDAKILEIYLISKNFGNKISNLIKEKIDLILITQIDYKLLDFNKKSPGKIKEIYIFMEKLKIKKEHEKFREDILKILEDIIEIHKDISYQFDNEMAWYEWITLDALVGIIFFNLVFYFNTNDIASVIVISLLCTSLCLLLFILKELNDLRWQEQNWIWKPLSSLFMELDLLPYFPESLFENGRLKFKSLKSWDKLSKVRIAHYPQPYPDMCGKKIEIVKI